MAKKKRKKVCIPITLPGDVIAKYRKVAKLADCTLNQALNVVLALEALKTIESTSTEDKDG